MCCADSIAAWSLWFYSFKIQYLSALKAVSLIISLTHCTLAATHSNICSKHFMFLIIIRNWWFLQQDWRTTAKKKKTTKKKYVDRYDMLKLTTTFVILPYTDCAHTPHPHSQTDKHTWWRQIFDVWCWWQSFHLRSRSLTLPDPFTVHVCESKPEFPCRITFPTF